MLGKVGKGSGVAQPVRGVEKFGRKLLEPRYYIGRLLRGPHAHSQQGKCYIDQMHLHLPHVFSRGKLAFCFKNPSLFQATLGILFCTRFPGDFSTPYRTVYIIHRVLLKIS